VSPSQRLWITLSRLVHHTPQFTSNEGNQSDAGSWYKTRKCDNDRHRRIPATAERRSMLLRACHHRRATISILNSQLLPLLWSAVTSEKCFNSGEWKAKRKCRLICVFLSPYQCFSSNYEFCFGRPLNAAKCRAPRSILRGVERLCGFSPICHSILFLKEEEKKRITPLNCKPNPT
jgi:hypothetical protein